MTVRSGRGEENIAAFTVGLNNRVVNKATISASSRSGLLWLCSARAELVRLKFCFSSLFEDRETAALRRVREEARSANDWVVARDVDSKLENGVRNSH